MLINITAGSLRVIGIYLLMLTIGHMRCFEINMDLKEESPNLKNLKSNSFEQFLNLHDLAEEMMNELSGIPDDTVLTSLPSIPKSLKEEFTNNLSIESETQTYTIETPLGGEIEVTEIKLVPKFKNLNPSKERANPFVFLKEMDSMFDDFFDSLAISLIKNHGRHGNKDESMDEWISVNLDEDEEEEGEVLKGKGKGNNTANNTEEAEHLHAKEIKDVLQELQRALNTSKRVSMEDKEKHANETAQIDKTKAKTKADKHKTSANEKQIEDDKKSQKSKAQDSNTFTTTDTQSSARTGITGQQITTTASSSSLVDELLTSNQKKKQIKDQKRKAWFAQVCKYVFYSIVMFTIYILVKKILEILGVKQVENSQTNATSSATSTVELPSVETRSNSIKSE